MNAIEVRNNILSWLSHVPADDDWIPSSGIRGIITGLINNALRLNEGYGEANNRRRQFIAWVFRDLLGKPNASWISIKDLSDEQWYALARWADVHKDTDRGQWVAHDGFNEEVYACWRAMQDWEDEILAQLGMG